MLLSDPKTAKLVDVIGNSFRVRKNQEPLYVELGNNLSRISAPQHQVIFGRRGSGKSCLMIHYMQIAKRGCVLPIYILADEHKKLTYPDVLIRLLLTIVQEIERNQGWFKRTFLPTPIRKSGKQLRHLLSLADESDVTLDSRREHKAGVDGSLSAKGVGSSSASLASSETTARTSTFKERKLEYLERCLSDYKSAIQVATNNTHFQRCSVLIDDFYLLPREWQPDIIDYLHRLLRDTDIYLKVATIRHRTTLSRNRPQTIGVETGEDVEELNLDRTLEDVESTQQYLAQMLNWMAIETELTDVTSTHFNPDALQALTLASGGVPRDFLNIFVSAIEKSIADNSCRWLTPTYVWKGASRLTYQSKLRNLREDADDVKRGLEKLLVDIMRFCLDERKKTAFLVAQDEAQRRPREHELIQQLMDMKLIHVVEPDTSAASGRAGRYEAYTLDFSLFMEPRRRNIEHVLFWEHDDAHRKKGIREAPVYSLERAGKAFDGAQGITPQAYLEAASKSVPSQDSASIPIQKDLFDRD